MQGPEIITRSVSALRIPDKFGNVWQYHPQSDRHSKIACWAIMFDLLEHCSLLRQHAADGRIGFGINHELSDFRTRRKKKLDLVVCTPNRASPLSERPLTRRPIATMVDFAAECGAVLDVKARTALKSLPQLQVVPVGSVCVALEAKAVMTEHIKALPRLHDELDSSHLTVHGHADHSIAAALAIINVAAQFTSPNRNKHDLSVHVRNLSNHNQPKATQRTIDKVTEIRRRSIPAEQGFDAIGIILVDFRNNGSPAKLMLPRQLRHQPTTFTTTA